MGSRLVAASPPGTGARQSPFHSEYPDGYSSLHSLAPPLQPGPTYPQGARHIRKAVNRQRLCCRWAPGWFAALRAAFFSPPAATAGWHQAHPVRRDRLQFFTSQGPVARKETLSPVRFCAPDLPSGKQRCVPRFRGPGGQRPVGRSPTGDAVPPAGFGHFGPFQSDPPPKRRNPRRGNVHALVPLWSLSPPHFVRLCAGHPFRSLAPPLQTEPAYPQGARHIRKAVNRQRLCCCWAPGWLAASPPERLFRQIKISPAPSGAGEILIFGLAEAPVGHRPPVTGPC